MFRRYPAGCAHASGLLLTPPHAMRCEHALCGSMIATSRLRLTGAMPTSSAPWPWRWTPHVTHHHGPPLRHTNSLPVPGAAFRTGDRPAGSYRCHGPYGLFPALRGDQTPPDLDDLIFAAATAREALAMGQMLLRILPRFGWLIHPMRWVRRTHCPFRGAGNPGGPCVPRTRG